MAQDQSGMHAAGNTGKASKTARRGEIFQSYYEDGFNVEFGGENERVRRIWDQTFNSLRGSLGSGVAVSWLQALQPAEDVRGQVALYVNSQFRRNEICNRYGQKIVDAWKLCDPMRRTPRIMFRAPEGSGTTEAANDAPAQVANPADISTSDRARQINKPLRDTQGFGQVMKSLSASKARSEAMAESLDPRSDARPMPPVNDRWTFENFVSGQSNRMAYLSCQQAAETPEEAFNPVFLFSASGMGKSHLLHAVRHRVSQLRPQARVLYMTAERFLSNFVSAIRTEGMANFKDEVRCVDVLLIDDVHMIENKKGTQDEFFHTIDELVAGGKQVILSADKAPGQMEGVDPRLRQRLSAGVVCEIQASDLTMRKRILLAHSKRNKALQGKPLPDDVVDHLACAITSNGRELVAALNNVIARTTMEFKRMPRREDAVEYCASLQVMNSRRLTVEDIQRIVADHFGVTVADILSARRTLAVVRPRQAAMYFAKEFTTRSLPDIGRRFGGKDHTTVMHAVKRVDELCEKDETYGREIQALRTILQGY